jgi:ABC-type nitrate/sulfonate/bicarbonate transport system permease component
MARVNPGELRRHLGAAAWGAVQALPVVVLLAGWELLAQSGVFTPFLLPSLSAVLVRIGDDVLSGALLSDLGGTLYRAFAGFFLAACVGVALGVLIARNRVVNWLVDPLVSVGFPTPKMAFVPVFMLWFGLYDVSKILLIAVSAVFPVIIATVAATRGVDKELIWSARSLGARPGRELWQIVLPAALPQILTGLQIALPTALIVAVATELLMGGSGIGGSMIRAARFAQSVRVFAGIVEIGTAGFLVIKGMELVRRHLLAWHQETQSAPTM